MHIANFSILTPEQTKHIKAVKPFSVRDLLNHNHNGAIQYINGLLKTSKTEEVNETYSFPMSQSLGNEKENTPIQTRNLNDLRELEQKEQLGPLEDTDSRKQFLSNFDWTNSILNQESKRALLVEFHYNFARHRFDIGTNTKFELQLMPLDKKLAYNQSLPALINLKDNILVVLDLLHKYGFITTLSFSIYASPVLAQRKPNGKLRLLVDLRKLKKLKGNNYINNNHPVSTLTDAAQHMAWKTLFCKLDCSQPYHCFRMADQQSIEFLAFIFASRTFANRRLAQGISRSLSAFSSFIRKHLHSLTKTDQFAHYVDDIGIAANMPQQLIKSLPVFFQRLRKAGLKLSMAKCRFGVQEILFFGRKITSKGVAPQKEEYANFLRKSTFQYPKGTSAVHWIFDLLPHYIPGLAERLTPFFQLLKQTNSEAKIPITPDIMNEFISSNEALERCCHLALRQPFPGKQRVLMTDGSFQASRYAVLIEDDPNQNYNSTCKTHAPIAYGSNTYTPSQLKMFIYADDFFAIYLALTEFGRLFCGGTKPAIIMADNKSVARFFQTKMIPPPI